MIVANRLTDGRVVFLAKDASWVESIEQGLVIDSDALRAEMLEHAERAVEASTVVDPYVIEVVPEEGRRRPRQVRESIRACGPTVSDPAAR